MLHRITLAGHLEQHALRLNRRHQDMVMDAVCEGIKAHMHRDTPPPPLPPGPRESCLVYVRPVIHAMLAAGEQRWGIPIPELMARYAWIGCPDHLRDADPAESQSQPSSVENELHEARKKIAGYLDNILAGGRIGLVEASTGTGKTRLILEAARKHLLASPRGSGVVIAVPYIAHMAHYTREMQAIGGEWSVSVLLGRRQFVSPAAVTSLLAALRQDGSPGSEILSQISLLEEWVSRGGEPSLSSLGMSLSSLPGGRPPHWLLESAVAIAPALEDELAGCCLDRRAPDPSCPAEQVYQAARQAVSDGDKGLALCTHAFLGSHALARAAGGGGLFRRGLVLMLDEAHLFEKILASLCTDEVALRALLRHLRDDEAWAGTRMRQKAAQAAPHVEQMLAALNDVPRDLRESRPSFHKISDISAPGHYLEHFALALRAAAPALEPLLKARSDHPAVRHARLAAAVVRRITEGQACFAIRLSRVLNYPALVTGPRSLGDKLDAIWGDFSAAALLSGTLYLDYRVGTHADYIRAKMHIPGAPRLACFPPVRMRYIYDSVTLHLPAPGPSAEALSYPGEGGTPQAFANYYTAAATAIERSAATAEGGMLVLCNSYADIDSLARLLRDRMGGRLLNQTPSGSVARLKQAFLDMASSGARPVWLATGSAWTGLDITAGPDVPPQNDKILTDLAVLRLPFGSNRSSTHIMRMHRAVGGMAPEINECQLLLRQGLGRLIRRPGLQGRRIIFLDGRIHSPRSAAAKVAHPCLACYQNRVIETWGLAGQASSGASHSGL